MKKLFFYVLACALPALVLTSCSSDDDEPSTRYDWGVQRSEKESYEVNGKNPSPTYSWLLDEIQKLDKNYSGSGNYDADDKALEKFDKGAEALKKLHENFTKRLTTHDACDLSFDVSYSFQVRKNGASLKKSPDYKFSYTRQYQRQEAKKAIELDILKKFADSKRQIKDKTIACDDLGLMDGPNMQYQLNEKDIRVVNANTYEYRNESPFVKVEVKEQEGSQDHELVLSYDLDEETYKSWQGKWYLVLPIRIISGDDGMTFNIKLNVNVK